MDKCLFTVGDWGEESSGLLKPYLTDYSPVSSLSSYQMSSQHCVNVNICIWWVSSTALVCNCLGLYLWMIAWWDVPLREQGPWCLCALMVLGSLLFLWVKTGQASWKSEINCLNVVGRTSYLNCWKKRKELSYISESGVGMKLTAV